MQTKHKHTPGPWRYHGYGNNLKERASGIFSTERLVNDGHDKCVCILSTDSDYDRLSNIPLEENIANTKLIAASPLLLDEHISDLALLNICIDILKNDLTVVNEPVLSHLECIKESKLIAIKKATE